MTIRTLISLVAAWVLCLAALVIFHVAYVMPHERTLAEYRRETRAKSDRFDLLTRAKSPAEQEQLKARAAALERQYSDFVFGADEAARLDFAIRAIADRNGLQDFSARRASITTSVGGVKLKQLAQSELIISFNGDFRSMLRFANDLERHEPVVFINQFTIRGAANKTDTLTCDMECSVLYQNPGK